MAVKRYLDYEGLQRLVENIDKKYAPIAALLFKGTVEDIAHLPAVNTQKSGWMYNVTVGGGTTSDFVEGPGHILADGENVAAVEVITYNEVTPVGTENPSAEGWFELVDGAYVLSADTTVDNSKTYYTESKVMKWDILGGVFELEDKYLEFGQEFPQNPIDGRTFLYMGETTFEYNEVTPEGTENPKELGWYEYDEANDEYVLTTDETVDNEKTYYTKGDEKYVKGVIYVYDNTEADWIAQTAGDTFNPITDAEIDVLFD